ncbi:MAG: arginase family protein [Nitrososphaerales archaeon]
MQPFFIFDPIFLKHESGSRFETPESKRALVDLLEKSKLPVDRSLFWSPALRDHLELFHTGEYLDLLARLNSTGGECGDEVSIAPEGYYIARCAVGACVSMAIAVAKENHIGYVLTRPPGHHALPERGRGFCVLSNVGVACRMLQKQGLAKKIAVIDYDVHHGNGLQHAFKDDPTILTISIHQDRNFPVDEGMIEENTATNINIPLPAGSGDGAYQKAFDDIIIPEVLRFDPDFIFVSSGFDANGFDPLAQMMLTSDSYRKFTQKILSLKKPTVWAHEGGYSEYCFLAVMEELCGQRSGIEDPYLFDIGKRGGQKIQQWQENVINDVIAHQAQFK